MTQIKIEVPSNDPIALSALGEALQRIAAERGYERSLRVEGQVESFTKTVQSGDQSVTETTTRTTDRDNTANVELKDDVTKREGDVKFENTTTEEQHNENMLADQVDVDDTNEAGGGVEDDTLDADGLPWDKRIHSRGKTRLADDTWRLARKPNDKTQEEWDEYVASVKAELKAVQDIPAPSDTVTIATDVNNVEYQQTQGVISPDCKVEVTLDEQAPTETLTPPVVETETVTPPTLDEQAVDDVQASEPVAAVEPPTSVTTPVTTDNTPSVSTFQELMKYITSDAAKRGATNDMIKEVLAQVDPSLTAIPLIANRADLIPTFVAKLEAKLS